MPGYYPGNYDDPGSTYEYRERYAKTYPDMSNHNFEARERQSRGGGGGRYIGETNRWNSANMSSPGRVATRYGSTTRGGARLSPGLSDSLSVLANVDDETAQVAARFIKSAFHTGDHQEFSRERRNSPPHQQRSIPPRSISHERHYDPYPPSPSLESRYRPHRSISPNDEFCNRSYRSTSPLRESEYSFHQERHYGSHRSIRPLQKDHYSSFEHGDNFHRGGPDSRHRSISPFHEHRLSSHEGYYSPSRGRPISPSLARIPSGFEELSHNTDHYEGLGSRDLRVPTTNFERPQSRPSIDNQRSRAEPTPMEVEGGEPTVDQMVGSASPLMGAVQIKMPSLERYKFASLSMKAGEGRITITSKKQMRTLITQTPKEKQLIFFIYTTVDNNINKVVHRMIPEIENGIWYKKGVNFIVTYQPGMPPPIEYLYVSDITLKIDEEIISIKTSSQMLELLATVPQAQQRVRVVRAPAPPGDLTLKNEVIPLILNGFWIRGLTYYLVKLQPSFRVQDQAQEQVGFTSSQMSKVQGRMPPVEEIFITLIRHITPTGVCVVNTGSEMQEILVKATKGEKLKFLVVCTTQFFGNSTVKKDILPLIQDGFWIAKGPNYIVTCQPSGPDPDQGPTVVVKQNKEKQTLSPAQQEDAAQGKMPPLEKLYLEQITINTDEGFFYITTQNEMLELLARTPKEKGLNFLIKSSVRSPGNRTLRNEIIPLIQDGFWSAMGKDYMVKWQPSGHDPDQGATDVPKEDNQNQPEPTVGKMPPLENLFVSKIRALLAPRCKAVQSPEHLQQLRAEIPNLEIQVYIVSKPPGSWILKNRVLPLLEDGIWTPFGSDYIVTWKEDVQHSNTGQGESAGGNQKIQQTTQEQKKDPPLPNLILKCHMCSVIMSSEEDYKSHLQSKNHKDIAEVFCYKANNALRYKRAESRLATRQKMATQPGSGVTLCVTCEIDIPSEPVAHRAHYNSLEHKLVERYQNVECCGIKFNTRVKFEYHCLTLEHIKAQCMKQLEEKKATPDKKVFGIPETDEKGLEDFVSALQDVSETTTTLKSIGKYDSTSTKLQGLEFLFKKVYYCCKMCQEVVMTTPEMLRDHFRSLEHYKCVLEHLQRQEKERECLVKRNAKEPEKKKSNVKRKAVEYKQDGRENPKKQQKVEELKTPNVRRSWENERKKRWDDDDDDEEENENEEEEENEEEDQEYEEEDLENEEEEEEAVNMEDTENLESENEVVDGDKKQGGDKQDKEGEDKDKESKIDESDGEFLDIDDDDPCLLLEEVGETLHDFDDELDDEN